MMSEIELAALRQQVAEWMDKERQQRLENGVLRDEMNAQRRDVDIAINQRNQLEQQLAQARSWEHLAQERYQQVQQYAEYGEQLAQARKTIEEYGKMLDQVRRDRIELQEENAAMRALLERTVVALHGGYQAPEDELDIREAIETFLAEHPQPVEDALVDEKDE